MTCIDSRYVRVQLDDGLHVAGVLEIWREDDRYAVTWVREVASPQDPIPEDERWERRGPSWGWWPTLEEARAAERRLLQQIVVGGVRADLLA